MDATQSRILRRLNEQGAGEAFVTRADLARFGAILLAELADAKPPTYVTTAELMRIFGVGREKIANALLACKITPVRLGSRLLYDREHAISELRSRFSA